MIRIYIDLCALKRPFDDQAKGRNWLDTQALSLILQAAQSGMAEWISSSVLEFENSRNPWPLRRMVVSRWMELAKSKQELSAGVERRALDLEQVGIQPLDALHLAAAEAALVELFVTSDTRIAQRYSGPMRVCDPTLCVTLLEGVSDDDSGSQ